MDDILQGLNPAQCEAVCHDDGPLLVLAGPGSGKTRVVTHRLARLLRRGVYPSELAALTFTNKAADEMRERLQRLAPNVAGGVWVGTFHRFCGRILRMYAEFVGLDRSFVIYDADDALKLLKSVVRKDDLPTGVTPEKIQHAISFAKNQLVLPSDYEPRYGSAVGNATAEAYPLYQDALKRQNAVDFDDMLLHTAVLLRDHADIRARLDRRFRYILVDEYQDTNAVQYAILKLLARDYQNLAVTGDPDQSIYGWRGADIENILRFEHDFPSARVVKLEQNYRSTPQILGAAAALIRHNKQRKDKGLHTSNAAGKPVRLVKYADQQAEAEYIASEIAREVASSNREPRDYAIFYRTNVLSRNLEHALRREGVAFRLIRGLEFYARAEIKDVLAYLRLVSNPASDVALSRIVNTPVRGIGKTTLQKCEGLARDREISLLDALRAAPSVFKLAAKTSGAMRSFVRTIDELIVLAADADHVEPILRAFLDKTRFLAQYTPDESEEDGERVANIEELLTVAREFDAADNADNTGDEVGVTPLSKFLEQTALVSDVDALSADNAVSLMTLHAAKGLEFPVVYLIAIEEGILPHERSSFDETQIEEERRLFFVGMTRAKEVLRLGHVEVRATRGQVRHAMASSFLFELPLSQFETVGDATLSPLSTESAPAWQPIVFERSFSTRAPRKSAPSDEYSQEVASDDGIDEEYDDEGRVVAKTRTSRK